MTVTVQQQIVHDSDFRDIAADTIMVFLHCVCCACAIMQVLFGVLAAVRFVQAARYA